MNFVEKKTLSGYPLIINYLGIFTFLIGFIILSPLIYLIFNHSEFNQALYFVIPGVSSIIVGLFIMFLFRGKEKTKLERNQDSVLVLLIWLLAIFLSSFPFLLTNNYSFTQSIFETTSGYSTTGFTIVNVEQAPRIFLLYRSLLQFFGGVGLVLILTSAISDKFGMRLYSAEGHSDKLMPNLIKSARMIMSIYVAYIIIGTISYFAFGMELFDAINHSISAVATGGFSTKANSIGFYNHVGIEIVSMILMILGGTNFFIHLLLIKGKFKSSIKHIELKFLAILTLVFIPIFVINLMSYNNLPFLQALRHGTYHFITTITTTGLQIAPSVTFFSPVILFITFFLMMIGAGAGSTAGGMKLYRVGLSFKSMYWNLKENLSHKKTIRTHFIDKLGSKIIIDKEEINNVYTFIYIYVLILFVGILIFTLHGNGLVESIFEFTSILGTIGLSYGLIQYSSPTLILWTGIVGMLIARLESYVIIVAITKIFIDITKRKK
jgi:trk system potassium uptake protein TrkH